MHILSSPIYISQPTQKLNDKNTIICAIICNINNNDAIFCLVRIFFVACCCLSFYLSRARAICNYDCHMTKHIYLYVIASLSLSKCHCVRLVCLRFACFQYHVASQLSYLTTRHDKQKRTNGMLI